MSDLHQDTRAAVIQLIREGKRPSWRLVRDILGGGSSTDLSRRISQIMQELTEESLEMADCPPELTQAFAGLWRMAKDSSAQAFEDHRKVHELRAAEAEAERDNMHRELTEAKRLLAQRAEQLAELNQTARSLESALQGAQSAQRRLEEQNTRLETKAAEQAVALEGLQRSHADALRLEKARHAEALEAQAALHSAALESAKAELTREVERYDTETARLMRELDEARQAHKQERAEMRASLRAAESANTLLNRQASALQTDNAKAAGQREALESQLERAHDERARAEKDKTALLLQVERLTAQGASAAQEVERLSKLLAACQGGMEDTVSANEADTSR